jgi:predicted membrane-bound mannosyltransferase
MRVIDQQLAETTSAEPQKTILEKITLEYVLYALITIAAAVLRILDLDVTPLSPLEAQEALNTWDFWQHRAVESIGSPGYFTITGLLSQVLGWNDEAMRLMPVLFGIGLVLLPFFLRHRTGRLGSITASLC